MIKGVPSSERCQLGVDHECNRGRVMRPPPARSIRTVGGGGLGTIRSDGRKTLRSWSQAHWNAPLCCSGEGARSVRADDEKKVRGYPFVLLADVYREFNMI
jgi:hypothetical protein